MTPTIASFYSVALVLISAYFYKHKDHKYADNKNIKIKSPKHFSAIYRYLQISTLIYVIGSFFRAAHGFGILFSNPVTIVAGLAIATIGIGLFLSAKLTLGKHYSPCFDSYVPVDIVQKGLYKYIRHPIYTANFIVLFGFFIASGQILVLANLLILIGYYSRSAQLEERALVESFPGYRLYQQCTGRFFPRFGRPKILNIPESSYTSWPPAVGPEEANREHGLPKQKQQ